MKILCIFPILFVSIFSLRSANAVAVTIGVGEPMLSVRDSSVVVSRGGDRDISGSTTDIQLSGEYNIYTDGNMFIDYSVFSENQDLLIGSNISITGQTVTIFGFNDAPTLPNLFSTTVFTSPTYSISEVGNMLLFSEAPFFSGLLEATGNLYIGNYSSLQPVPLPEPVPLPASAVLLLSGFVMLGGGVVANNRFSNGGRKTHRLLSEQLDSRKETANAENSV